MLNGILRVALNARGLVLVAALLLLVGGLNRALHSPIDVLPNLDRPIVTVLTDAHGRVTADVERLVTQPIERALLGAAKVERVRSTSTHGFSIVNADFDWDTDIFVARQIVAEKLGQVSGELPGGAEPTLGPVTSIMGQIQVLGFQSTSEEAVGAFEIRRFVDREVVPRLTAVEGVAQVIALGGQPAQVSVAVDAARLRAFGATLIEVAEAVRESNVAGAGGTVATGATGPQMSLPGLVERTEEIAAASIHTAAAGIQDGEAARPIIVADVAGVALGPSAVRVGDAGIDGGPGVLVIIAKQPDADTRAVTRRVDLEVAAIAPSLPDGVQASTDLFRQSDFIDRAIGNVFEAVRDGGLLVVLILFLFLLELRTTLITLAAIPMAIAITAIAFEVLGLSINTMTLGGLAVAIGTLVDDAIVDVENVYRRLFENSKSDVPRPLFDVVFDASSEVRRPVVYGTLVVTIVYLPLFFLSGIEGRLFAPVGIAFVTSVFASTLVALTLTPVLCYYLLRGAGRGTKATYGGPLVRPLRTLAGALVRLSVRRTHLIAAVSVGLVFLGTIEVTRMGTEFLPPFNEGSAQVNISLPPETNLEVSSSFGRRLETVLLEVDGVRSVARRTGREPGDEHAMPIAVSEAIVVLDEDSGRSREAILDDIRDRLELHFPGVATSTEQPLAHLLSHLLSGVTAQVAIKLTGTDLDELHGLEKDVMARLQSVPGVVDLYARPQIRIEEIDVVPDRAALAERGMTVATLAETVELALGTEEVSWLQEGRRAIPISVGLRTEDRGTPSVLASLSLGRNAAGESVRVGDVVEVRSVRAPNQINRENGERLAVVQHNVSGRALGDVVADVEAALAPIRARVDALPGYSLRVSGQFEAQRQASRVIVLVSALAALFVVVILSSHFQSARLALLVLATRPVSFVGGVAALMLTGQDLSIASLVGFVALFGFAARNAILLLDHTMHLARTAESGLTLQLLQRAAQERIVPVLMTALTSGIGLLPLAMGADQPGKELLYPVATVILGGLVTNTVLDFILLPGLFWRGGWRQTAAAGKGAPGQAA